MEGCAGCKMELGDFVSMEFEEGERRTYKARVLEALSYFIGKGACDLEVCCA